MGDAERADVARRRPDLFAASASRGGGGRFDWSELHDVLDALPRGRWTSYGDLAELVGTAPRAVGTHLGRCPECTNAWRVVGGDGRARCSGPWGEPAEPRTQADLLRDEGVRFSAHGDVADPTKRLTPAELVALARAQTRNRERSSPER